MSGGSYDYLFGKEPGDSYDRNTARALSHRLLELGYSQASKKLDECYLQSPSDHLRALMKAVEWFDSADWTLNTVYQVAAENGWTRDE